MKVILTERVKSLGNVGEIVNVSAGYGRNYLIPNRFAVLADEGNKKQIEHQQRALEKKVEEQKSWAKELSSKIEGLQLSVFKRVGTGGKLFGAVTTNDISNLLAEKGHDVERRVLSLTNPVKALGTFEVKAKFYKDVEATLSITVEMDPKQIEEQKKKSEEAKKVKAEEAKAKAEAAAESEGAEGEEGSTEKKSTELTEEQKLKQEADKILRSF